MQKCKKKYKKYQPSRIYQHFVLVFNPNANIAGIVYIMEPFPACNLDNRMLVCI